MYDFTWKLELVSYIFSMIVDAFFLHENGIHFSSLAAGGKIRSFNKADIVACSYIHWSSMLFDVDKLKTVSRLDGAFHSY